MWNTTFGAERSLTQMGAWLDDGTDNLYKFQLALLALLSLKMDRLKFNNIFYLLIYIVF